MMLLTVLITGGVLALLGLGGFIYWRRRNYY